MLFQNPEANNMGIDPNLMFFYLPLFGKGKTRNLESVEMQNVYISYSLLHESYTFNFKYLL